MIRKERVPRRHSIFSSFCFNSRCQVHWLQHENPAIFTSFIIMAIKVVGGWFQKNSKDFSHSTDFLLPWNLVRSQRTHLLRIFAQQYQRASKNCKFNYRLFFGGLAAREECNYHFSKLWETKRMYALFKNHSSSNKQRCYNVSILARAISWYCVECVCFTLKMPCYEWLLCQPDSGHN